MRAKLRKNIGKILSDNKNCTINYIITFIKAILLNTQNNIFYIGKSQIPMKNRHYKIFCVNVKYRIQNRVLYFFILYIYTQRIILCEKRIK